MLVRAMTSLLSTFFQLEAREDVRRAGVLPSKIERKTRPSSL